ncbi:NUDIX hydrolase [Arthrobacter halodurans]|uniref:NUDIX domain-containing protein n=1 Tax=Arthrobacter halodurans TaxID=516699 RepID=A0ABV4UQP4_9MICC
MPDFLTVAAVRLLDNEGRILLARKRGTSMFMQPGGKLEPGESPAQAAVREVREETGLDLDPGLLEDLGVWTGPAANEADTEIVAHLFGASVRGVPRAAAELEELLWARPADALLRPDIAPLLRDHVLPGLLGAAFGGRAPRV